jgi:hypothetical protein
LTLKISDVDSFENIFSTPDNWILQEFRPRDKPIGQSGELISFSHVKYTNNIGAGEPTMLVYDTVLGLANIVT